MTRQHQKKDEVARELVRANDCHNNKWRLWTYVSADRTLILCGSRERFHVTGFLIFRGTALLLLSIILNPNRTIAQILTQGSGWLNLVWIGAAAATLY